MGLFGLFDDKKNQSKIVDLVDDSVRGVGKWIDNLQLTDQEKLTLTIDNAQKIIELRTRVLERTADESTVRSISRRILAWAIAGVFLFLVLLAALAAILEREWINDIVKLIDLMSQPFMIVVGFYFVAHIGNGWIEKFKKPNG